MKKCLYSVDYKIYFGGGGGDIYYKFLFIVKDNYMYLIFK